MAKFYEWLQKQEDRDDPVGDLARDVKYDKCWPKHADSINVLYCHLEFHQACEGAYDSVCTAWDEFIASLPDEDRFMDMAEVFAYEPPTSWDNVPDDLDYGELTAGEVVMVTILKHRDSVELKLANGHGKVDKGWFARILHSITPWIENSYQDWEYAVDRLIQVGFFSEQPNGNIVPGPNFYTYVYAKDD